MTARLILPASRRRHARPKNAAASRPRSQKRAVAKGTQRPNTTPRRKTNQLTPDETHVLVLLLLADAEQWNAAERRFDSGHIAACRQSLFKKLEVKSLAELVLSWSNGATSCGPASAS